jgi:hypothetical protein
MDLGLEKRRQQRREAAARWRQKNLEHARKLGRERYRREREKKGFTARETLGTEADRTATVRERWRKSAAAWRRKYPERQKIIAKRHYERHREKRIAASKAVYWKDPEKSRAARRLERLSRVYGITEEQFRALGTTCHICGSDNAGRFSKTGRPFHLSVDHCHDTGKVRGLLCNHCNVGIGFFKNNPALLLKTIAYLRS